jgi:hypothetical protein
MKIKYYHHYYHYYFKDKTLNLLYYLVAKYIITFHIMIFLNYLFHFLIVK